MKDDKLNLTEDQMNQIAGGSAELNMPTGFFCPECGSGNAEPGPLHHTAEGVVYKNYVCRNCGKTYSAAIGKLRPRKTDDHR